MIQNFKHRGLKNLYAQKNPRGVRADQADKIARILARLDETLAITDMDIPGFRLHPLKGALMGYWSVSVSGNWRIVFRFEGSHAYDINLVDYH